MYRFLSDQHLEELVTRSGIDCNLADLNFKSLQGRLFYEYLLICDRIPRNNAGQVSHGLLQRYADGEKGGWWCSGLDPLNDWGAMEWGCYKPNHPRQNQDGKLIKYEHPPLTPTRMFCLRVTLEIWQRTSSRYHVAMPENIVITESGEAVGFWAWVVENNISVIICEGAKKAAALLSQGYAAIALPGITSGYRVTKDCVGKVMGRQLIPDLAVFTKSARTFYICFDYETQPKTINAVNNAIAQLGELLQQTASLVKVIRLPGLEKGVDEFIVAQGAIAFQTVYQNSTDLETDLAKIKPHSQLTYKPTLTLNRRYLGKLPFPKSGLVGVKSPKGTGKTTALLDVVTEAQKNHQPVLLLTHRIQLGRFLCDKIGVEWINHKKLEEELSSQKSAVRMTSVESPILTSLPVNKVEGWSSPILQVTKKSQSLGLCIDSIWKLKPEDWQGAIIILDEVEQSLWHLLNSSTCKDKRVLILKKFQQLISIILQTGGLVIAQDADLSDLSLDYMKGLAEISIEPWVVVNEWKPQTGCDVTFYNTPNPTALIQQLEQDLILGRKCYVTTDSRSGRYSSEAIEQYIKQRLEQFQKKYPKTLVVSSQTTSTHKHEALDFIKDINQKVKEYSAVFVTPSLGTGVSIDVEHFDSVYGIFQGVIPDWEARQALARVRPNVTRHVWCAKRGVGLIGSGSKNYRVLSHWYQENHKENLALMSPLHKVDVDLPLVYDFIHLRNWARFAARVNGSITLFRYSMQAGLIAEGHQVKVISNTFTKDRLTELRKALIIAAPKDWETSKKLLREIVNTKKDFVENSNKSQSIKTHIRQIRQDKEVKIAYAVANAPEISYREYQLLNNRFITEEESYKLQKYILQQRYGVTVTPRLKQLDDQGYYPQLLLHYYLTHDSEYFRIRDKQEWYQQLWMGDGKVFIPDVKTYTLKIEALRALGVTQFLEPEREFQENDSDLINLKLKAQVYSKHIKRSLGIKLPVDGRACVSTIKILSIVLSLLGLKLKVSELTNSGQGDRIKIYCIDPATLNDGRQEIFSVWDASDALRLSVSQSGFHNLGLGKGIMPNNSQSTSTVALL
ncbi:hypothetical protein Cri9333_1600 [Crinalium epipsammum PCC 9333]|uniref:DUF3854 domain-containing protein n=1 Tax=Crinalium epipsammum PCC 9333 TaxID=1173022 RepID=K9VZB0_9CYAN|nr:plasmid replication protein, CyRepA1 family [Crinalium epipsammum]AFZ12490.1 hypothetical protein Cri9333_1600 [Crinalium epipsammum PCC 9333]